MKHEDIEKLRERLRQPTFIDGAADETETYDALLAALTELSALRERGRWRRFGDERPVDGQPCLVNIDGDLFLAKFEASSPDWDSLTDVPQWSRSARAAHLWLPLPEAPR